MKDLNKTKLINLISNFFFNNHYRIINSIRINKIKSNSTLQSYLFNHTLMFWTFYVSLKPKKQADFFP